MGHSRSPLIHSHWLKKHHIDGIYDKRDVAPPDLQSFFVDFASQNLLGCNVTIPHKVEAISYVDFVDDKVSRAGSINTVYLRDGKLHATSTDGFGFIENIKRSTEFSFAKKQVVLLGAGGSARQIIAELIELGVERISVANRTLSKVAELISRFGPTIASVDGKSLMQALRSCDLLVNSTSIGMNGQLTHDIDLALLPPTSLVTDIVYVPLKTRLILDAEARGLRAVPGLGMLLHQAKRGFELWFGVMPEVTPDLYDLVARDIDPSYTR